MPRNLGTLSFVLALVLSSLPAGALDVDVELHGRYDLTSYRTWAWRPGIPAKSRMMAEILGDAIEEQMAAEGLELVEGEADCYLSTFVIRDSKFPAGVLKVDIADGESGQLAWRGMAYGVVDTGNRKKIEKIFHKAIRRMFGKFPETPYH